MDTNLNSSASFLYKPRSERSTLFSLGIPHSYKATVGSFSLREVDVLPGARQSTAEVEQLHDRHSDFLGSSVQSRGHREPVGSGSGTVHVRSYVRQLGVADVPAIEEHLLKLTPSDRRDRFLSHTADEVISEYVRRLNPFRAVLIGAFDLSERVVGFAEVHPTVGTRKAEAGVTVDVVFRRRGLGRQLVARALGLAFALGVQLVEFNFMPNNRSLVCLVRSLGGRIGPTFDYASIARTANWIGSAKAA
jgi:GNAT superfamily N-acetyltransferase